MIVVKSRDGVAKNIIGLLVEQILMIQCPVSKTVLRFHLLCVCVCVCVEACTYAQPHGQGDRQNVGICFGCRDLFGILNQLLVENILHVVRRRQ